MVGAETMGMMNTSHECVAKPMVSADAAPKVHTDHITRIRWRGVFMLPA
jgi:hypothetical protein